MELGAESTLQEELNQIIDDFYDSLDKKEYFSYVGESFKSTGKVGYISVHMNMSTGDEPNVEIEVTREYKTLECLKDLKNSITDANEQTMLQQVITLIETINKETEFVMVTKLTYDMKPLSVNIQSFSIVPSSH